MPADSHLQGEASRLGAIVVSGQNFYRWAPEIVSCSLAVEVVPRSAADALADALRDIRDACEPGDPIFTTAATALTAWAAYGPAKEEQ
jgi:hypothetical protein